MDKEAPLKHHLKSGRKRTVTLDPVAEATSDTFKLLQDLKTGNDPCGDSVHALSQI